MEQKPKIEVSTKDVEGEGRIFKAAQNGITVEYVLRPGAQVLAPLDVSRPSALTPYERNDFRRAAEAEAFKEKRK
jgi:hypothetical protein